MEHRFAWEGEEQKCTNLYKVVQGEEMKYIDEEEKEYSNLMSFRNNNTNDKQPDKENKRKRKYDRTSPEENTGKDKQIGKKQEINKGE